MKKADIKTGFGCNNNCLFCVQGHKKEFGDKTTPEVMAIIKEARRNCDIAVFTGGEPTIRKDILQLVNYAKKIGFKTVQIQSNGRMFAYRDFCRKIIAAGANEYALALHGHTAELHDWLTQSQSFLQTVVGIKNLRELDQRVIMNAVITKSNYRHLPEIARLLAELDVDQFQFAFVHALGSAEKNFDAIVPRMELVVPYLKKAIDFGRKFGKKVMVEAVPPCFLAGYEDSIAEFGMPDMEIFDLDLVIPDYKKSRLAQGKSKGPRCQACGFQETCEGPWKEYPDKFGWDEFKPVKKPR
jgi:MoaA/NifB/PqqE/SkfB family radical SAM enzyme